MSGWVSLKSWKKNREIVPSVRDVMVRLVSGEPRKLEEKKSVVYASIL